MNAGLEKDLVLESFLLVSHKLFYKHRKDNHAIVITEQYTKVTILFSRHLLSIATYTKHVVVKETAIVQVKWGGGPWICPLDYACRHEQMT